MTRPLLPASGQGGDSWPFVRSPGPRDRSFRSRPGYDRPRHHTGPGRRDRPQGRWEGARKVVPNVREGSDRVTVLPEKGRTPLVFHKEQIVGVTAEPGPLDEYLVRRDRASSTADRSMSLAYGARTTSCTTWPGSIMRRPSSTTSRSPPLIRSWATSCTRTAGSPPTNSARPRGWSATRAGGSRGTRRRNARRERPRSPSRRRGRVGSASCARRSSPAPKTGSSRPVAN